MTIDEKTAVEALFAVVRQYAREHNPPFTPKPQLPEGIRLEMHPLVRYMIIRNMDYRDVFTDDLSDRVDIPVKINTELPEYGWRLVIVTEDVINGGVMPHEDAGPMLKEPSC